MVYQGHDRLNVTGWIPAKGDKAGLALAILIDESAGFSLGTQLNDIKSFINEQPPSTLIAIGYMQNGTVKLVADFTQDHAAAAKSIRLALGYFGAEGSPYLKKLNEQLPNQFLLSFQPKPEKKAGLESIKVTSEIHDVDFVHQNNVCVQAEPKD